LHSCLYMVVLVAVESDVMLLICWLKVCLMVNVLMSLLLLLLLPLMLVHPRRPKIEAL
jgi:hypothetical protein